MRRGRNMRLTVDTDFPGGRVAVVRATARGPIELALETDSAADVRQWFAFRVIGPPKGRDIVIVNAAEATYAQAWPGYRAMATVDGREWFRVPTELDGDALVIRHDPRGEATKYAYFATYPVSRLSRLLRRVNACPWADVSIVAQSLDGEDVPLVTFGDEDASSAFWIVARQHPGETPASFAVEGMMKRLASGDDPVTRALLERACVRVVPLVNPDGAELGNMRTNASGVNLNRVWDEPDALDAPEVAGILSAIEESGVDLFFDIHADEECSYAFAACSEGNPGFHEAIAEEEAELRSSLSDRNEAFLDEPHYDLDPPGAADLSCASNQIGERFGVASITLELPIKDDGNESVAPGWSTRRAIQLGFDMVDVLEQAARRR